MYAVIECGGRQSLVKVGDKVIINRVSEDAGKTLSFKTLLVKDKERLSLGKPLLKDCVVNGEVIAHFKGKKVTAFKYRRRKGSEVKKGHRSLLSQVLIKEIKVK